MTDYNLWLDNDRQARLLLPLGKNTRGQLWTLNFIVGYSIIGLAPGVTAPATHAETEPDADGSNVSAVCLLRKNRFFLRRQTPGSGPQPSARLCQSHDWQQCNQEAWILFFFYCNLQLRNATCTLIGQLPGARATQPVPDKNSQEESKQETDFKREKPHMQTYACLIL